jgi:hypothetical protein
MKQLIFLFAFALFGLNLNAQTNTAGTGDFNTFRFTTSTYDTLSNADSVIYVIPDAMIGASFPSGAILDYTVYTKAVSGTTTALVAYPEYTNFPVSQGKWFRDYNTLDSLQIVASTFNQNIGTIGGLPCYARHARIVIKQTGTAVRIVGLAVTTRKRI